MLSKTGLVLGLGIVYAIFVRLTGWGLPCVFSLVTGVYCPGCGISRMFLALFRLDFVAAARYNLLVLCLLPFGMVLYGYKFWCYVKTGRVEMHPAEKVFYIAALILCIVFSVLRNTTAIPFFVMPDC